MNPLEQAMISGAVLGLERAVQAAQERYDAASTQEERDRARRFAERWRDVAEGVRELAREIEGRGNGDQA